MFLRKIFLVIGIFTHCFVYVQNNADYSMYNYSLNLINPAFAGQKDNTEILFCSKVQWIGLSNSPRTSLLVFNMPFKSKRFGLGLSVSSDRVFITDQTTIAIDGSYKIEIIEDLFFQFGLKARGNIYKIGLDKIKTEEEGDEFFAQPVNRFSPNFAVGGVFLNERFYIHFSIDNLLEDLRNDIDLNVEMRRDYSFLLGGGTTFRFSDDIYFLPSMLIKFQQYTPLEIDLHAEVRFDEEYNVSLSYFWNNSMQLSGMISAFKWLKIGYGYRLYSIYKLKTYTLCSYTT